ncbi:hypothetical protein TrVFT333_001552 [Trichoderma virens FT-333]|nr:hypothetical protein TrVFT333_001552 [Trichoderma virens FT-333]
MLQQVAAKYGLRQDSSEGEEMAYSAYMLCSVQYSVVVVEITAFESDIGLNPFPPIADAPSCSFPARSVLPEEVHAWLYMACISKIAVIVICSSMEVWGKRSSLHAKYQVAYV